MFRKRFIALVMALTMLLTLMAPAFAFAEGEEKDDPEKIGEVMGAPESNDPEDVKGGQDPQGDPDDVKGQENVSADPPATRNSPETEGTGTITISFKQTLDSEIYYQVTINVDGTIPEGRWPEDPTLDGHNFGGWVIDGSSNAANKETTFDADATLVPNWIYIPKAEASYDTAQQLTVGIQEGYFANGEVAFSGAIGTVAFNDAAAAKLNALGKELTLSVTKSNASVAGEKEIFTLSLSGDSVAVFNTIEEGSSASATVTLKVGFDNGTKVTIDHKDGEDLIGTYEATVSNSEVTVTLPRFSTLEITPKQETPAAPPSLPTATVTMSQTPATGVAVYSNFAAIANGQPTGNTVDLGVEYTFTANAVTNEQYDYYKGWYCDYRITFTGAIDANTFGLYGKMAEYNLEGAFVIADSIANGDEIYLLSSLGQPQTYKDIKDLGTFVCGAFNLSDTNQNIKNMKVELVMWPATGVGNPTAADIEVIGDAQNYTFADLTELTATAPALPTATVTMSQTPATGVAVYSNFDAIANGQPTGNTVDLGVEYTFTANAVTNEQYDYYKGWYCDYRITFTGAIDANTFGLYGKMAEYNLEGAFVIADSIANGDEIYLLSSLGQPQTYKDIKDLGTFVCGAFNLSDTNKNIKNMKVELVMWPATGVGNPTAADIKVIGDAQNYTFADLTELTATAPALPTATVTMSQTPATGVAVYSNFDAIANGQPTGNTVDLGVEYTFTADAVTDEQYDYYKGWYCDYRITFTGAIDANTFGLYGKMAKYNLEGAFVIADSIANGDEIYLLSSLGQPQTYKDIKDLGTFVCGAFNLSDTNQNIKNMKVELVMWPATVVGNPTAADIEVIGDAQNYTFADLTELTATAPALPTANMTEVDQKDKNIPIYDSTLHPTGDILPEPGVEYLVTPVQPTQEQIDYYGNWCCDWRVTFNKDLAANSFGLFGAYGSYNVAFVSPIDIHEGDVMYLLTDLNLDDHLTYNEVLNNVQTFKCGAFNLSEDNINKDKVMTVELVMWKRGEDKNNTAAAVADGEYDFGDLTVLVPPLPTANMTEVDQKDKNIPIYDSTLHPTGDILPEPGVEYLVTPVQPTQEQIDYYGNWCCDWRVTFNKDLAANSFGLFGAYGSYNVAFVVPDAIAEGDVLFLLADFGLDEHLTYNEVLNNVQTFKCGAFNLSEDNINKDKVMTVELVMWKRGEDKNNTAAAVADGEYDFGDLTVLAPPLPTATLTEETAKANVDLYGFGTDGKLNYNTVIGKVENISDVFTFTAEPVSEETLELYGDWRCDFQVTFADDMAAGTFGLYGGYTFTGGTTFDVAFASPIAVTANRSFNLVETLMGQQLTYREVYNNVSPFTCGAFNLDGTNSTKGMKVELIIWDPNDTTSEPTVIKAKDDYKFGEPTQLLYQVTLTSAPANGATLSGGGIYADGTQVVLKVENIPAAYRFTGWYDNNERISTEKTYTHTVTKNVELVAKFEEQVGNGLLHVEGSSYTVNNGTEQTSSNDFYEPLGQEATVEYVGDDFLYWVNYSNNIVSTSNSYTFMMVGDTTLKVKTTGSTGADSVYVVFKNAYKQVLYSKRVNSETEVESIFPGYIPSRMGYDVADPNWVFEGTTEAATPETIFAKKGSEAPVIVVPNYTPSNAEYTLTVKAGESEKTYSLPEGKQVIKAAEVIADFGQSDLTIDTFSFWSLDSTTPISTDTEQYTVVIAKDQTVYMMFNNNAEPVATVAILQQFYKKIDVKDKIGTSMRWFVPESVGTVYKTGYVYCIGRDASQDELVIENKDINNIGVYVTGMAGAEGLFTLNATMTDPDAVLSIRAFAQYMVGDTIKIVYSDKVSATVSQLQPQP